MTLSKKTLAGHRLETSWSHPLGCSLDDFCVLVLVLICSGPVTQLALLQ